MATFSLGILLHQVQIYVCELVLASLGIFTQMISLSLGADLQCFPKCPHVLIFHLLTFHGLFTIEKEWGNNKQNMENRERE